MDKKEFDSDERLQKCFQCEHIILLTSTCKKCSCFMYVKTKFKNSKCPLGKW